MNANRTLTRREALRRGAVVGAAVWAAPVVTAVPAMGAEVSGMPPGGELECTRTLALKWNVPVKGKVRGGQAFDDVFNNEVAPVAGVDSGWAGSGGIPENYPDMPTTWPAGAGNVWNDTLVTQYGTFIGSAWWETATYTVTGKNGRPQTKTEERYHYSITMHDGPMVEAWIAKVGQTVEGDWVFLGNPDSSVEFPWTPGQFGYSDFNLQLLWVGAC